MTARQIFSSFIVLAAAVGPSGLDPSPSSGQPAELTAGEAVQIMRRLNTAQAKIATAAPGKYGALAAVLQQDSALRSQSSGSTESTASFAGYTLTLMTAGDGRRYHASLTPERTCGLALFTNESGLIYRGRVLDCPAD